DELKALLIDQKMSIGDFFRVALKKQQIDYDTLAGSQYGEGYEDGFGCFNAPCEICGKPMTFDIDNEQKTEKIIREAFKNWHHTNCSNE
ncbi:unnamed protein product, partial [marine sediment metagenome]